MDQKPSDKLELNISKDCEVFDSQGDRIEWNSVGEIYEFLNGKQFHYIFQYRNFDKPEIIKIRTSN